MYTHVRVYARARSCMFTYMYTHVRVYARARWRVRVYARARGACVCACALVRVYVSQSAHVPDYIRVRIPMSEHNTRALHAYMHTSM